MRRRVFVFATAALLASCIRAPAQTTTSATATATATATASAAATVTAAELIAVAKAIYPYLPQYGYYSVCGVNVAELVNCPVTQRLKTFLTQKQITLCGCQNPALSLELTADPAGTGGVAHVLYGGATGRHFDLIIVRSGGALLVDDQECTGGGPATSIYVRTDNC